MEVHYDGVDLSEYVKSVKITPNGTMLDYIEGSESFSMELDLEKDRRAAEIESTITQIEEEFLINKN